MAVSRSIVLALLSLAIMVRVLNSQSSSNTRLRLASTTEPDTPEEEYCGVWPSPPEGHNLVQLFVEVDDIDAYIEKAKKLGATVIVPKSELPDGDALAIVLDPAGLSFALYRPRPRALS